MSAILLDVSGGIATLTLNRTRSLNALTPEDYQDLGEYLREIDERDDVVVTILQGNGRYFCAGTDVRARTTGHTTPRDFFIAGVARTNTATTQAFYSHRKILVAALNGPVLGIMAAFLGQFDFIYAMPEAWLSTPFSFLGIGPEANSSSTFLDRLGIGKAKEVLIWGKKLTADELLDCGFVNRIFPASSDKDFHTQVRQHVLNELANLDPKAILTAKKLIQEALKERNDPDALNLRESFSQARLFATGRPAERFRKIANKEIKHKL